MSKQWEEDLAGGLLGLALVTAIVVAVVIVWFVVKATNLVIRVMVAHPKNKAMWAALALLALASVAALVAGGRVPALNTASVAAFLGLVVTAKVVEVAHDPLLQTGWNREALVHEVLHEPWWNAA